ncbi:MAG: hypothetical protein JSU07_06545 [Bacteroidetes bacterium]|nr:hypothetical protein [Bacteroidota bacterium]
MKLNFNLIKFTFVVLLLSSCGGSKETEATGDALSDTAKVVKDTTKYTVSDTTKFKFDFAIANIPSPANSMQELAKWGMTFNNSFLNDPSNIKNYTTEFSKAINLGVYNIDMAYAMVHDNGQEVLKYMKGVVQISDNLGLKNAVSGMVGKRAENNISNKDSLFKILDEIFVKSDSYLRTNERVYTAAIIFAGSWLESLYITCQLEQETKDNSVKSKAQKHLWEQRFHLGNLLNLLNDYKDKKDCANLNNSLKPIHEEITAIKDPKDMTAEKFKSISAKLIVLRNSLTK